MATTPSREPQQPLNISFPQTRSARAWDWLRHQWHSVRVRSLRKRLGPPEESCLDELSNLVVELLPKE